MKTQRGFTLLEIIVLIVVLGIMSGGFFLAFSAASKGNDSAENITTALDAAQTRMEILLGWEKTHGYSSFTTDPCASSPPAACSVPSGYTVSANISAQSNYKIVTVTVSGTAPASLTTWVYNY